jgi:16S rRNA (uracil1498-N3)-methyltransferase
MSNVKYMLPRFYAPDLDPASSFVTLPAEEARHLTRVLRMKAGDALSVFDGRGTECRGVVDAAVRDTVNVRLAERLAAAPDVPVHVTVVQAVLKGGSMDDAVRDATMMGAASIVPVLTEHVDVKAAVVKREETLERWRRVALAAVKQSRRATLPSVAPPQALREWIAKPFAGLTLLFVEPSVECEAQPLQTALAARQSDGVTVLLGPEGGWAAAEVTAALDAGARPVTLGPLTLRAESMPVAALAALYAVAR